VRQLAVNERAHRTQENPEEMTMTLTSTDVPARRRYRFGCTCCATSPAHPDRRGFLASGFAALGAAAVGATVSSSKASAQAPATPAAKTRIDVHHHFLPEAHRDALEKHKTGSPKWSVQMSLDDMDKSGIATAFLSQVQPGTWYGDAAESRKLSRIINEYGATLVRDHPGRFGLFATISPPDTEGSLKEIEYVFDTLKADGLGLLTSYRANILARPPMLRSTKSSTAARR
jgi:hypothetical protein